MLVGLLSAQIPAPILICALLIWSVALWPRLHCIRCGRNRAGRMAGGTIDSPICIDCVDRSA